MRGKPASFTSSAFANRITPADAGKTVGGKASAGRFPDHPRGCGENLSPPVLSATIVGSPPRMRGKQPILGINVHAVRITPADAGKTCIPPMHQSASTDHPRGCGENMRFAISPAMRVGSPPRMRGKLCRQADKFTFLGITPADAGKTSFSTCLRWTGWDHPRGCGENRILAACSGGCSGSPPRMRGKLTVRKRTADRYRITPADAGKTL